MTEPAWFLCPDGQVRCQCEERRAGDLLCGTCEREIEEERQLIESYEWEPE